jgi:hypothetical protein
MRNYILCLALGLAAGLTQATAHGQKGSAMAKHASGTFDVKIIPQKDEGVGDATIARMSIDKQYHGDLEGSGKGDMLTAGTDVKGSAVYVAIERFTGALAGRRGGFSLHHRGIMDRGAPSLSIAIVPDSGTDELAGISGTMTIEIKERQHLYMLDYDLG